MFGRILTAVVLVGVLICAGHSEGSPKKSPDDIFAKLRQPTNYEGDVTNVSLFNVLQTLSKKHDVTFIVNDEEFQNQNMESQIREMKPRLTATRLDGLPLERFLRIILGSMRATYLVRKDYIEIVPVITALRETKPLSEFNERKSDDLEFPLVNALLQKKSLSEAVAELAEVYDATIVLNPAEEAALSTPVSARLLNVPMNEALDLLTSQVNLQVIQKGKSFFITTPPAAPAAKVK